MVEKCISRYGLRALLGTIEFPPVDWDLVHFNTTRWKQALYLGKGRFHNTIHMMEWIKLHQVNLNIEIQCQVPFSCWCAWVQRIHHGKHQSHIRHTSYVHLPERVFSSPYNILNIYNNQFEHNQCSWNRWNTKGFGGPTMGTYTNELLLDTNTRPCHISPAIRWEKRSPHCQSSWRIFPMFPEICQNYQNVRGKPIDKILQGLSELWKNTYLDKRCQGSSKYSDRALLVRKVWTQWDVQHSKACAGSPFGAEFPSLSSLCQVICFLKSVSPVFTPKKSNICNPISHHNVIGI